MTKRQETMKNGILSKAARGRGLAISKHGLSPKRLRMSVLRQSNGVFEV